MAFNTGGNSPSGGNLAVKGKQACWIHGRKHWPESSSGLTYAKDTVTH